MTAWLVTGAIGSGKSEVCRYLASKGFPVYDCDSRTKMLYDIVPGLKCRIEEALGVPFEELPVIFGDASKREKLESIVYPYVFEDIRAWMGQLDGKLAFIESAIAMSKPLFDSIYDKVLLVRADYGSRLARNPKVKDRDALQSFDESRVDKIIDNNSSLEQLHREVDNFLKTI
ncbi:MAG: dephospho-CoA kinase [Bacteroidia bacterium]|nr:dephospho-CoA kinase [Bacteroidia bacterium]